MAIRALLAFLGIQWSIALTFPTLHFLKTGIYTTEAESALVGYSWMIVSVGLLWRVFARKPRPFIATIINASCLALIAMWVVSSIAAGYYPVSASTFLLAAFWMTVRTSVGNESKYGRS